MRDLLLVGGGGHCKAVIDVVEKEAEWRIVGVVDSGCDVMEICGYPVLGSDDELPRLSRMIGHALVTVGQIKTFKVRAALYARLKHEGFVLPTVISPLAEVSKRATLGEGTVIMHFGCIGSGARIGCNSIINTRALVEHGCLVGNHCHISTASVLNGDVRVGDGVMVGSNSVVRQGIAIGAGCIVGMGSVLRADLPPDTVYLGGKVL